MKQRVIQGQSFFDIANQLLGNVDAAFAVALENGFSVTDQIPVGFELEVPESDLKKVDVAAYFDNRKLATYIDFIPGLNPPPQGIGFMAIEVDFIVS